MTLGVKSALLERHRRLGFIPCGRKHYRKEFHTYLVALAARDEWVCAALISKAKSPSILLGLSD